jgi:hypothetical protein
MNELFEVLQLRKLSSGMTILKGTLIKSRSSSCSTFVPVGTRLEDGATTYRFIPKELSHIFKTTLLASLRIATTAGLICTFIGGANAFAQTKPKPQPTPVFSVPSNATSTLPIYGAWKLATSKTTSGTSAVTSKQYLYVYQDRWYISPITKLNWSWDSGQQVTGTYTYFNGTSLDTVECLGSTEIPTFGVGCSEGPGNTRKVIPWATWISGADKGTKSPSGGQGTVCQSMPSAFGPNTCYYATIYVREVYDLLTDAVAATLQPSTSKQYLYIYQDRWYRSPATTLTWSWQYGQQLVGTYSSFNGTSTFTFGCQGSFEQPTFGVGCSEGPGGSSKVLPIYENYPATGQGTVCQDQPAAFGPSPCYLASIYVLER